MAVMHENWGAAERLLELPPLQRGTFIVLPELSLTSAYLPSRAFAAAFALPCPTVGQALCAEGKAAGSASPLHAIACFATQRRAVLVANVPLACAGRLYNSQVALGTSGQVLGMYHKHHIYDGDPFDAGPKEQPASIFLLPDGRRVGLFICFDMMFAEPGGKLLLDTSVDVAAFSSWWVNLPPLLTATQVQQGWAARASRDLVLVASNAGTGQFNSGSGVYATSRFESSHAAGEVWCQGAAETPHEMNTSAGAVFSAVGLPGIGFSVSQTWMNSGNSPKACGILLPAAGDSAAASAGKTALVHDPAQPKPHSDESPVSMSPAFNISGPVCGPGAPKGTECMQVQLSFLPGASLRRRAATVVSAQQGHISCRVAVTGVPFNGTLALMAAWGPYNGHFNVSWCALLPCDGMDLGCVEDRRQWSSAALVDTVLLQADMPCGWTVFPQSAASGGALLSADAWSLTAASQPCVGAYAGHSLNVTRVGDPPGWTAPLLDVSLFGLRNYIPS